jgi:hypothetical protein
MWRHFARAALALLMLKQTAWAGDSTSMLAASFAEPVPVAIEGYDGHAMEPFITRDGKLLFFNNRNAPEDQTDLHVAKHLDDLRFTYVGPVTSANSKGLDGVASIDVNGNFFFVSTRDYDQSGNTLWTAKWNGSAVSGLAAITSDFTPRKLLRLNIDLEISADGKTLYFAENRWDLLRGVPATSDLAMAKRVGTSFERLPNSDALMATINSKHLEFAPATTSDELTLYFTRLNMNALRKGKSDAFALMVATRLSRTAAWSEPAVIPVIQGFVEAPTVTPDGCAIYFHKKVDEVFRIFRSARKC